MADPDFENHSDEAEYKSKTQLKNESQALYKLGQSLVDLGPATLEKLPLGDDLSDAITLAKRINRKKDGFRRQLQFINKLLRGMETGELESAMERLQASKQKSNDAFHHIEKMRDDILQKGDEAINVAIAEHPQLDRQKLRQMLRQANKEQQQEKPPKTARELFKYLKEMVGEA